MKQYAVSVLLTKNLPDGTLIATRLRVLEAASAAEAEGISLRAVMDECPDHGVRACYSLEIPDPSETNVLPG